MKNLTDEYIINKIIKGNPDYLTHLFDRYNNQALNYFFRMTGNLEDSRDLTQNLFFRILKYKNSFKQNMVFKFWMYKIAKNLLTNHYSSLQKQQSNMDIYNENLNISDYNPDEDKMLFKAISQLPYEYKGLIILNRFTNLKYKEIAEIFETTEASIRNKLYRALNKLREVYFKIN